MTSPGIFVQWQCGQVFVLVLLLDKLKYGSSLTITGAATVAIVSPVCAIACAATVSIVGGVIGAVLAGSSGILAAHALPVFVVVSGARAAHACTVYDPNAMSSFLC